MVTTKLTHSAKSRITADWQRCFPHLGVRRPMSLLKRNGPLLVGIYLDRTRSNDVYLPLFHIHSLMWPSSDIALGLCQGLAHEKWPRLRQEIPVKEHELRYERAAERLAAQIPELTTTDTTLSGIMRLYSDFLAHDRDPAICRFPQALYTDEILLLVWAGEEARARQCFEKAAERMSSWPPHEVNLVQWKDRILNLMDKQHLETVVEQESKVHGVQHIPRYALQKDTLSDWCLAAQDRGAVESSVAPDRQ